MAPFPPQHPPGGGPAGGGIPGGMNVGPGGMNGGMNMGGPVMNMPGGMGGAPGGINPSGMPGGLGVGPGMNPGMNVNGPGMGGMGGPPNGMNMGPGVGMPNAQRQGMGMRKVGMPMGGVRPGMAPRMGMGVQNGMGPGIPQGGMGAMPTLTSGMPNMAGAQGGMGNMGPGAGGPGGPGGASGMGGMMQSMGGGNGGMSVGAQQGGMGGGPNMGPGSGPGMGGSSTMAGMGSMGGLNSMGGPGAPGMGGNGMRSNTMGNGPWLNERQYSSDGMVKRPGQLDDFNSLPGSQPPGHHLGPQPQHPHGVGGSQIGGPGQHGVGGPNQMAPHPMGPQLGQQQPPSQPTAGSPVGNLPAHHTQQLPGQIGGGTPGPGGPMGPGAPMGQPTGTPRMATPGHPGGQLLNNPPAPSPHRIGGSPAHHQGHPHQSHIGGSPAHQQMSSPRHITSSSPAPGQGPNSVRSNAPTPVPPRGASADPMGMRPEGMGQPADMRMPGEPQAMMRMAEGGIGNVVRGPDGSLRPANEMMVLRDGRLVRDMQPPMEGSNRAPSADGMGRPGMGMPPNGMRPGEIGRLGPDGAVVRGAGPYNPPYGAQGGSFSQPYGGIHPTPAQQHQNMQRGVGGAPVGPGAGPGGVPRSGSVDDIPGLGLGDDLTDVIGGMPVPGRPGPGRGSLPPQMPMNGVPGGPGRGPAPMMQRRPTLMQGMQRPIPLGMGVVRMLEMSQELSNMKDKMLSDWVRFREEYFTQSGKIAMTIFYGVEGRKYMVSPEIIPRFFLSFFESGVGKISLGLNGATESTENIQNEQFESCVSTLNAVWRYELDNGWVVEHNGPVKIHLVAEPTQGEMQPYKLKIEDMTCNAPTTSYFFRPEKLEGNLIPGPGREVGPMTPRISPGLAARQTGEPVGDPNIGLATDEHGVIIEHEERLVYEKASLPAKPFQTYGLPASVWRLLAMSACVHELVPVMELEHSFQTGAINALEQYAEMEQNARHEIGLDMHEGIGGHPFPNFHPGFSNPPNMPDHSPALAHAQAGMQNGLHQGAIPTTGRPTPTPPPLRQGPGQGGPGPMRAGMPLAGSGELPPLPGLGVGIPPGMSPSMIMSQSPLLSHPGAPGQPPNGQLGVKRKQQPEQGPDPNGGPSGSQQPRGVANMANAGRMSKSSPVLTRKKAKTNPNAP